MAEEELGLDPEAPEVVDALVEDVDGQPGKEEEQPEPTASEIAREMGWKPKEEFTGPPEDWKPAHEFLKASRDINRGLSRDLRGVRDQLDRVTQTTSQIMADKISERDAYWRRVHAKAVEDGNLDLAEQAVDERSKLKNQAPAVADNTPPETQAFKDKNKNWYGKDPAATARAHEIAERLAAQGYSIPEQLQAAERIVRKEFTELFDPPAKTPAAVATAASRNAKPTSRAKGFNDMPPESQKIAKQFQADHGIKLETFAANYWANEAKQRRA